MDKKILTVKLNTMSDIYAFVGVTTKSASEVDIRSGRFIIDGKSILGVLSMDLSKPVTVTIWGELSDINQLAEKIKELGVVQE